MNISCLHVNFIFLSDVPLKKKTKRIGQKFSNNSVMIFNLCERTKKKIADIQCVSNLQKFENYIQIIKVVYF